MMQLYLREVMDHKHLTEITFLKAWAVETVRIIDRDQKLWF